MSTVIAIGDEDGGVTMRDTRKNRDVATLTCHANAIFDVSWFKNDECLFTACGGKPT